MRPAAADRKSTRRGLVALGVLLALLGMASAARAHDKEDEKLPPPPVRLRVIAPSAQGPWILRIDNESDATLRLAADVRLLRFEVHAFDAKKKRVERRPVVCDGPSAFGIGELFPAGRDLLLEPGQSYVEPFDPRLICFGEQATLLTPNAVVRPVLGWSPRPKWSTRMETAPFVLDTAERPRQFRPLRRLEGPTLLLSHAPPAASVAAPPPATEPAPGAPPAQPAPPRDELAAALTLTASPHADARDRGDALVAVQAHNTGQRPIFVALRARQLSFVLHGPDGRVDCPQLSSDHEVPRDLFRIMHHGTHVHMPVRLAELCPEDALRRPGLYLVAPTLHADSDGSEYGLEGLTGVVTTHDPGTVGGTHHEGDDSTIVRVRRGPRPFYRYQPEAVPTSALPPG